MGRIKIGFYRHRPAKVSQVPVTLHAVSRHRTMGRTRPHTTGVGTPQGMPTPVSSRKPSHPTLAAGLARHEETGGQHDQQSQYAGDANHGRAGLG